ncbi:RHS repeat domain-containing protein [Sulfurovum sp.]|uniref:RHS repeat domain-containing protein n=1 Tax=Sulfurovum sp. TaxID=1969726 RepID=UPI0035628704
MASKHFYSGSQRIATKMVKQEKNGNSNNVILEKEQYYYHPDHLGSSSFVTDEKGKVYEHLEYFPFGETFAHEHSNTQVTPYKFTGKELDEVTGLYYYGARYYDPRTSVWQSPDPIIGEYMSGQTNGGVFNPKNLSLFAYTYNNPVNLTDPAGLSPVYDPKGNFLGTDDGGLKGDNIVMDSGSFTQSMSPADAKKNSFIGPLEKEASGKMNTHYSNLSSRPDYDGYVSREEGVSWAKSRPNNIGTPDDALYFDAAKMDFGALSKDDFKNGVGKSSPVQLFRAGNVFNNKRTRDTTYALGSVDMVLSNNDGDVRVVNNSATRYDWNQGGNVVRKAAIWGETKYQGLDSSHGFPLSVYGTGRLNKE